MKTQKMFKKITLIMIGFLTISIVSAKEPVGSHENNDKNFTKPGSATIYFFRPKKFFGSDYNMVIIPVPKDNIPNIRNGKYYVHHTKSVGDIKLIYGGPEPLTLTVEDGKTYYLQCGFEMKGTFLYEVDENNAKREIGKLKEMKTRRKK